MGIWELDHQLYDLHHLMVLCYYLQHPQLYSREGLAGALALLRRFAVDGAYVVDVREQMRPSVQQGTRTYPITARPDNVGVYSQPVVWTMTAGDVVAGGVEQYYENIRAWTGSVVGALRAAGVMD
jgi:hypothetical protein